ncbi:MAG: hypothetical protein J4N95_08375 [Chloroflexi bacterium]|nr:hypothetical protein [Chloroflexota bacterium]MCI0856955.1 hypothetical protein [Chloroflexota bacterium]MCI0890762.1 hypothetical protein [Chloroflexota bacterium]
MRFALLLVAVLMAGVVFAACGDDDDNGDNVVPPTAESPADDGDTPDDDGDAPDVDGDAPDDGVFSLPESGLAAPLIDTYDTATPDVPPPDADLPVPSGSVIARWYQENGLYVVYYDGLDLAISGPLCPGNSIETAAGFEFITNAPAGAGACSTATTILQPPAGVQLCGDDVLYVTAIRVTAEGTLFGTIERFRDDSTIIGLTSQVVADAAAAPEVDLSSCEIPEGI